MPDEQEFREWYAQRAAKLGLDPNPDDPRHHYDYRRAHAAGAEPGPDGHWPSEFKAPDHPNRYVNGEDTITGKRMSDQQPKDPMAFMDSPWVQLGGPIAAMLATAIAPRHTGKTAAMGLAGLNSINDYRYQNKRLSAYNAKQEADQQAQAEEARQFTESNIGLAGEDKPPEAEAPAGGTTPRDTENARTASLSDPEIFNVHDGQPQVPQGNKPPRLSASQASLINEIYKTDPSGAKQMRLKALTESAAPKPESLHVTEFDSPEGRVQNVFNPNDRSNAQSLLSGPKPVPEQPLPNSEIELFVNDFKAQNGRLPNAKETLAFKRQSAEAGRVEERPSRLSAEDAMWMKQNPGKGIEDLWKAKANSSPRAANRILSITDKFGQEQVVKDTQTLAHAVNFMAEIEKNPEHTPTDDQGMIYMFAKSMDPNSVVRESEYKTVAEYSQALLTRYGYQAKRVFLNSGFISPEARRFMRDTIKRKYNASKKQYDALEGAYNHKIQNAEQGGAELVDYSGGFPQNAPKQYKMTATNPKTGQKIGSNDGVNWDPIP